MTNPLLKAYRKPSLYISLPSGGKFYKEKPKLSADGELAVYAMTARDELITKTPDALFNGEATHALITSCCPDIPDANDVPVNDLLVILLAIRQATYGRDLNMDMNCPSCEELNMLAVDGAAMLGRVKKLTASETINLDNGFVVGLKPYNLHDRTLLQIQQVQQRKMIDSIVNADVDEEERSKIFGEAFIDIAELTVKLINNCITSVKTEEDDITDSDIIGEWLQNITKADYDIIKDQVEKLSDPCLDTTLKANCQHCGHEWKTEINLDIANFFEG